MKSKIENGINTLLIALLPIMSYINILESTINISFADIVFPMAGILILIQFKYLIDRKRWIYFFYFLGTILSTIISYIIAQNNQGIISVPYIDLLIEIIKIVIVGGYFYIGYMFVTNSKKYKIVLFTLSIGSIPVGAIALGAYISYLLDIPFFIKKFIIQDPIGRVKGTFEDPNLYAFYLIMIIYISLWNAKFIRNKVVSFIMILVSAFSVILLIMTMSRSGWLAFAGSLFIFGVLNINKITKQSITIFLTTVLIVFLGVQFDYSVHEGKIVRTVMDRIEKSLIKGNEADRFQLSRAAVEMGNDNFLFGVGKGNFSLNSYIYLGRDNVNYKNGLIPHNTILGTYAQQGIFGLSIFLILPIYLFYSMIKSKGKQKRYMIPLLGSFAIQSFAINVENVRFLWYLFGIFLASTELSIDIEVKESNRGNSKKWIIVAGTLFVIILGLFINISRHFYTHIIAYGDKIVQRKIKISEKGIYTLSFDIQTNEKLNRIEVYEKDKLLKSFDFKSAYGKVEEPIELNEEAIIRFISSNDGWMKINNAHIIKDDIIIPIYSYPLVPKFVQDIMQQKQFLVYADEPSFKSELSTVDKNRFEPLEIKSANIRKYSNLSTILEFEIICKDKMSADYHFDLRIQYDSIADLLPTQWQGHNYTQYFGLYPKTSEWKKGNSYTVLSNRVLTSTDFKLYGRFYDPETQVYPDEKFFEIPFKVTKEVQDVINPSASNWINVRYTKNEENKIVFSYNGWVETKKYILEPGDYNILFKAQGSLLENEYSTIRIRDSYLNEIRVIELNDSNKVYSIPYKVLEKQPGISFILELINYENKENVGDRRILLEDWIKIERID